MQRGPSARLKQTSQSPIFSLTSRIASASAFASSALVRRTWNASRCAVRLPTPGSLPSSVTRRWRGGASRSYLCLRRAARLGGMPPPGPPGAAAAEQAAEAAHAAELLERRGRVHAAHAAAGRLGLEVGGLAHRLVDRGHDHVLEHLDVLGVDRVRVDRELLELEVAGHHDLDHAAAGGRLDALVLEPLLRLHHLLLHLLRLLEQGVEVRLGHQDSSSAGSSSASNSRMKRSMSSSSERVGVAVAWGSSCSSARA